MKTDDAMTEESGYYDTITGVKRRVVNNKVWKLKVKWDSVKTSYITLKYIRKTNPMEIEEYKKYNKTNKEPEFAWWVLFSL